MGERHEDQEHIVEPVRPPITAARAHEVTAGLREAMDDVRRSVEMFAAGSATRTPPASRLPLGRSSWESYADSVFGISRAQACRILDVARTEVA
ncbi:hypothetical protein EES41_06285 [Streptomyces sp. ADI95-16]|nr:hypothetical protein EES41_06285 [Streptomyces sp. ADI95-16]